MQCLEQAVARSPVRKVALAPVVARVEVAELVLVWEMVVERQVLSEVLAQDVLPLAQPEEHF